jgi:hypothetical protein
VDLPDESLPIMTTKVDFIWIFPAAYLSQYFE